jgi:hypothetical protein
VLATPGEQNVVLNTAILRKAEALIESCPEGAGIPFDNILDRVTSSDPSVTDTFWSSQRIAPAARVRFWKKLSLSLGKNTRAKGVAQLAILATGRNWILCVPVAANKTSG